MSAAPPSLPILTEQRPPVFKLVHPLLQAVKVLLDLENVNDASLTLSNPVLVNLHKASWGAVICYRCGRGGPHE